MQFNIPTLLTLFRVILIPFFVLVFYLPVTWSPFAAALIFCVAAVTDWFDGFLARRWNQSTRFGAFLDPVADKVLVAIAMVLVTEHYHSWWVTLPAATMIAREIIISALVQTNIVKAEMLKEGALVIHVFTTRVQDDKKKS